MTRGKTARERHHEKQLMRILSHALASKMRNLHSFSWQLHPQGHLIIVRFVDKHWLHHTVNRRRKRK